MELNKVVKGILALSGAWLLTGCSTPEIPDVDADQPDTAWWAYQDCLESLPVTASDSMCDGVGTVRSMPRYQYTNTTGGTTGGRGPYGKASSDVGVSRELASESDEAFRTYLNSLDAKTQSELIIKWKALSGK